MALLINPKLHVLAGVSLSTFFSTTDHYFKTYEFPHSFNCAYPGSNEELAEHPLMHDIVRGDFSSYGGRHDVTFAISTPDILVQWVRGRSSEVTLRQATFQRAAQKWSRMHDGWLYHQTTKHLLRECDDIISRHFFDAGPPDVCLADYDDYQSYLRDVLRTRRLGEDEQEYAAHFWEDRFTPAKILREVYLSAFSEEFGEPPHDMVSNLGRFKQKATIGGKVWATRDDYFSQIKENGGGFKDGGAWELIQHHYAKGEFIVWDDPSNGSLTPSYVPNASVYLIYNSDTGYTKIGYTASDPVKRLAQLQTGNHSKLTLVGSFSCADIQAEKRLHAIFADRRSGGEWFQNIDHNLILNPQWRASNGII